MGLQPTITAVLRRGESRYVAECVEIAVATQGNTLEEVVVNLQEAVAPHLPGEDLARMGLAPTPTLVVSFEVEPAC
jgi:predicted RNase H-like HicB family nuclease